MTTAETSQSKISTFIEVDSIYHSFKGSRENFVDGEHVILADVSFQVRKGEVLGIIGRNGAGKTTLLRFLAGILAPSKGEIRRGPRVSCAVLSLGLGFHPHLTGRDNARLASILQGNSRSAAIGQLAHISQFADLGPSFDEPVRTYSSGMKARLGFATALFTDVDVLLIDEVLAVGDAEFKRKARDAMRKKISGKQTVVLVSHSTSVIRGLCDRAILLERGVILASGKPKEVLQKYEGLYSPSKQKDGNT